MLLKTFFPLISYPTSSLVPDIPGWPTGCEWHPGETSERGQPADGLSDLLWSVWECQPAVPLLCHPKPAHCWNTHSSSPWLHKYRNCACPWQRQVCRRKCKKKKSIVVRSCFTQKCFVFLIWQWCNGDRWQSWQLTCWKVSRNGKMKSAIELFFNFFSLYPNGENIFSFSFLSWYRKMSPKTRMPRWSKSSVERWPSSCTCSSWSEITTQI